MPAGLKTVLRIFIGCILPPPLGVFSLLVVNSTTALLFGEDPVFVGMDFAGMDLPAFGVFALFSYAAAGTQAVIYSLLMEFIGQRVLKAAGKTVYLFLAALLGTLAGATLMEMQFALAGSLTGLIVGVLLLFISRQRDLTLTPTY